MRNNRQVGAFLQNIGDAKFDDVFFIWDFPLLAVEKGVFHDKDRVIVADCGFHEPFGVVGIGRTDDLQTGVIGHHVFWCVRVSCPNASATIGRTADYDRYIHQAAGHVAAE